MVVSFAELGSHYSPCGHLGEAADSVLPACSLDSSGLPTSNDELRCVSPSKVVQTRLSQRARRWQGRCGRAYQYFY